MALENMEDYRTDDGLWIRVHTKDKCKGAEHCPVHNPSLKAQQIGYTHWRDDRRIIERVCAHGIGHPDPDGISDDGVHGCDGCCQPPYGVPGFAHEEQEKKVKRGLQQPQKSEKTIETERLDCVRQAETHLFLLKSLIWGRGSHHAQHEQLEKAIEALKPLKVQVIENGK